MLIAIYDLLLVKYLTILRIKNFKLVNAFLPPKSSHFSLLVGYNI